MTGRTAWAGDWRVVLAAGLAVLTAGVVTLVAREGDPATADTYVASAVQTELVVDGRHVSAEEGMLVPAGATVITADRGAAILRTASREVYVGAATTLHVSDGVRQSLERGLVMVDGRDGPRLSLMTLAGLAAIDGDSLARVETDVALRLAVFDGHARMTALGRRATTDVPELYQLRTPYGGLPGSPTALALKGDQWERTLAADLVAADEDLQGLARGLEDVKGQTVLAAAPAALRTSVVTGTTRGEQALAVAVAQAAEEGSAVDNLATVQSARREGGSWGVVAALVSARVSAVSALLDAVLEPAGPPPQQAGPDVGLNGLLTPAPSPDGGPTPGRSRDPRPTSTRKPTTKPSTTASPSASSTVVDDVITTVQSLFPTPTSTSGAGNNGRGILPLP